MQIKILIVDDVKANLISLRSILEEIDNQFEIIDANSGEEALEIVLMHTVDLIILDIQMPIMDGFEVAKFIKSNKLTRDIPIIFLTAAFKSEEFVQKGFELGAVDYLTKPINEYQLTNRITLYANLFRQMSENRRKDRIMFQQSKMASMGDMLANIAHQWRQPLSAISTLASGLKLKTEMDLFEEENELVDELEHIVSLTQHLSKTIEDFRTFFRQENDMYLINLEKVINKSLYIIDILFKNKGIEIIYSLESISFKSYENELIQVLLTMLNNAKDALETNNEKEKLIFISTKCTESNISIMIKDNAGGVPLDIIDKVFEPYFTTKHQSQGTGIGLYIANEIIVKHMKGQIHVQNVSYNHHNKQYIGAEFTINLPISS